MKRAFRDAYNRELALLYERAAEFAAEYPGIADRLGGLLRENTDPAVAGLLEGSAFLAARVQLKMDEEFSNFTSELLDQVFPEALAPVPSAMLVRANVPMDGKELAEGLTHPAGTYIDARFVDADQRVSCRFRLTSDLTLWPIKISNATYHSIPAPISALGIDAAKGVQAGLQLDIERPEISGGSLSNIDMDTLDVHLTGPFPEAVKLYEQINCNLVRAHLRYLNAHGDPVFQRIKPEDIEQIGFDRTERLLPQSERLFDGFALLREAFVFPRKFLGFQIKGMKDHLKRVPGRNVQIIFEFDTSDTTLATRLDADHLSLHCVPALNLFEDNAAQLRLDRKRHEFVITPDSNPVTHYEVHAITEVFAHYAGSQTKVQVHPLYAVPDGQTNARAALYFTANRKARRLTEQERRFGRRHRYLGTETFIRLYEPPETTDENAAQRLQIKTMNSNRHLPEYLPIAGSEDDFYIADDKTITFACVAGPTPPREPLTELDQTSPHRAVQGHVNWRLLSYLSLNHFGLDDRPGSQGGAALREMMSLFCDLSDSVTEAQINGLVGMQTRPVTRAIRRGDGFLPARGIEVELTFDEDAFEGSGIILLGAILDRFLSEYASVNSFVQTTVTSRQRGKIKTFPPRSGSGPLL
ncbi:MAG: type VI secretion system baseplate subunit TssF [Aliishimia sp.]